MAERTFFGNRAVVYMGDGSSSAAADKVLIVENFTASLGFTIEELYGMGSIARQDVARHTGKIEVSFKCFSIDLTTDAFKAMISGGITSPTGEFKSGTGDGSVPEKYFMTVYLDQDATAGSVPSIQLTDVVFDKFPVTGDDKSWMGFEFNGTASGYKLDMAGSIPTA